MGKDRPCEGSSCGLGGCTPCAYLGLFVIVPYSIYLLMIGRLLGLAFLAYGAFIGWPLVSKALRRATRSPDVGLECREQISTFPGTPCQDD